jgi:hypothetical protein
LPMPWSCGIGARSSLANEKVQHPARGEGGRSLFLAAYAICPEFSFCATFTLLQLMEIALFVHLPTIQSLMHSKGYLSKSSFLHNAHCCLLDTIIYYLKMYGEMSPPKPSPGLVDICRWEIFGVTGVERLGQMRHPLLPTFIANYCHFFNFLMEFMSKFQIW